MFYLKFMEGISVSAICNAKVGGVVLLTSREAGENIGEPKLKLNHNIECKYELINYDVMFFTKNCW